MRDTVEFTITDSQKELIWTKSWQIPKKKQTSMVKYNDCFSHIRSRPAIFAPFLKF